MPARDVTVCAGVSGSGKSTFVVRYLLNAPLSMRFIFDPDPGEFNPAIGEYADRLKLPVADDLYSISKALCHGWVCFDPHKLFPGALEEALEKFCEWAWEKSLEIPGQKVLYVDEVWAYMKPQYIPPMLAQIARGGRKRGLRLVVSTQEPNLLHSTILNGVSEFVAFKLEGESALKVVASKGLDPQEVRSLPPLQFVSRNIDSGGVMRGKIEL